jgi:hypothetical protein
MNGGEEERKMRKKKEGIVDWRRKLQEMNFGMENQ